LGRLDSARGVPASVSLTPIARDCPTSHTQRGPRHAPPRLLCRPSPCCCCCWSCCCCWCCRSRLPRAARGLTQLLGAGSALPHGPLPWGCPGKGPAAALPLVLAAGRSIWSGDQVESNWANFTRPGRVTLGGLGLCALFSASLFTACKMRLVQPTPPAQLAMLTALSPPTSLVTRQAPRDPARGCRGGSASVSQMWAAPVGCRLRGCVEQVVPVGPDVLQQPAHLAQQKPRYHARASPASRCSFVCRVQHGARHPSPVRCNGRAIDGQDRGQVWQQGLRVIRGRGEGQE